MKALHSSTYIFLLTLIIIASSCRSNNEVRSAKGIQKRKYMKGYSIDLSNKHKSKTDRISIPENHSPTEGLITASNEMLPEIVVQSEQFRIENSELVKANQDSSKKELRKQYKLRLKQAKIEHKLLRKGIIPAGMEYEYRDYKPEERKIEPFGLVAGSLSFLGVILIALQAVGLAFLLGLVALILAAISMKRFKKYPTLYKGKFFPWFTMGLGLGLLFLFLVLLLVMTGF